MHLQSLHAVTKSSMKTWHGAAALPRIVVTFVVMEKERRHREGMRKTKVTPRCIHCSCFGW